MLGHNFELQSTGNSLPSPGLPIPPRDTTHFWKSTDTDPYYSPSMISKVFPPLWIAYRISFPLPPWHSCVAAENNCYCKVPNNHYDYLLYVLLFSPSSKLLLFLKSKALAIFTVDIHEKRWTIYIPLMKRGWVLFFYFQRLGIQVVRQWKKVGEIAVDRRECPYKTKLWITAMFVLFLMGLWGVFMCFISILMATHLNWQLLCAYTVLWENLIQIVSTTIRINQTG